MKIVTHLYRYPVKGLSPESLTSAELTRQAGLAFDREYALALGSTHFDEKSPVPLEKGYFLMLRNNEKLAALSTRFDTVTHELTIEDRAGRISRGDLTQPEGRRVIEAFFANYLWRSHKGATKGRACSGPQIYRRQCHVARADARSLNHQSCVR